MHTVMIFSWLSDTGWQSTARKSTFNSHNGMSDRRKNVEGENINVKATGYREGFGERCAVNREKTN
jgi:hypothetical protein